jgi:hypothetical protein
MRRQCARSWYLVISPAATASVPMNTRCTFTRVAHAVDSDIHPSTAHRVRPGCDETGMVFALTSDSTLPHIRQSPGRDGRGFVRESS